MANVFDATTQVPVIKNFSNQFDIDLNASSGLNISILPGNILNSVNNQTAVSAATALTLNDNTDNYIAIDPATSTVVNDGAVQNAAHLQLYVLTTSGGYITNCADLRLVYGAVVATAQALIGLLYTDAGGTQVAYTGDYPAAEVAILLDGYDLTLDVGAIGSNTTVNPTFTPTLKTTAQATWTIVKKVGNATVPLAVGDVQGICWLKADVPNAQWVLMNPAMDPNKFDARFTPGTFNIAFTNPINTLVATFAAGQTVTTSYQGANTQTSISSALVITLPTAASLGFTTGQQGTIGMFFSQANNCLAVANISGAPAALLTDNYHGAPTVISAGSTSASTIYSATGMTASDYKLVGFVEATWTNGTGWAITGTYGGASGASYSLSGMNGLGWGQTWQTTAALDITRTAGTTYYNTTGRPIEVKVTISSSASYITDYTVFIGGKSISHSYATTNTQQTTAYLTSSVVVPDGESYLLTLTSGSISNWAELR
jgi:hypothetical protein